MTSTLPSQLLKCHLHWQLGLFRHFLRHIGGMTLVAAACRAVSQFAQLFSLFIPLKIMLILGAGPLPRFMQDSLLHFSREAWVAGLTVATLVLYVGAIVFELLSNRIVGQGGGQLADTIDAGEHLTAEQRKQIREIFGTACRGYANLAVFGLGVFGLLFISPLVFLLMLLIISLQVALTNRLCRRQGGRLAWVGQAIARNPAEYVKYLASLNFLCVFGLLLLEYLLVGGVNSITAILTLLLARRMFQSLGQFGVLAVKLERMHPALMGTFFRNF